MDEWVLNALQRWPNVPALFGWLSLDRRGRWLVRGETISHPRIIEVINRNYAVDEHGRWYFQNGPQRGYMQLQSAPLILFVAADGEHLVTHTGLSIEQVRNAHMDEEGAVVLVTEHGPGEVAGADLQWVLDRLFMDDQPVDEESLAAALQLPSGTNTAITLQFAAARVPMSRLDFAASPLILRFERSPAPREGEKSATGE